MNRSRHENGEELEDWTEDYSGEDTDHDALQLQTPQPSLKLIVSGEEDGLRFDRFVAQHYPEVSRSRIQKWIADGFARLDAKSCKVSQSVHEGQNAEIAPPADVAVNDWQAEPDVLRQVEIVFEDSDVLVINKPAALVVHPAAGHPGGTLVNGLLAHCFELSKVARCGIVHRLDRDTTGLMVVAKTPSAQFSLVQQLQQRSVSREYLALAWGVVAKQSIHTQMGRDARDRQRMAVLSAGQGKEAVTHIEPTANGELCGQAVTLVRCRLETGRTHQIRVHMEHIGNPIVGDPTYAKRAPHASKLGNGLKKLLEVMPAQALHALRLQFIHPTNKTAVDFKAKPPENFLELLKLAGIKTRGLV